MGKGGKNVVAKEEPVGAACSNSASSFDNNNVDHHAAAVNDPAVRKVTRNGNTNEKTAAAPPKRQTDFVWSATDEPHATRRKRILAKHPEIKELYGHCRWLKYKVLAVVALQLALAHHFRNLLVPAAASERPSWLAFFLTAYTVGGTCNHMMMMALHELSHNLGFRRMRHNRWFAVLVANLPIAVPAAVTFKRYHMDHHKFQGVDGIDVDLPTVLEGKIFNNAVTKFFFVFFQVAFYSLRPGLVHPKPPGWMELANWTVIVTFDAAVAYFWGVSALLYLLASSVLGMGLHPVAGHFIAEHFVFPQLNPNLADGQDPAETYSYYGFCNHFTLNVGYHNEHHDFPFVPGSRLPRVREIAAEFYDDLPHHTSYCKVLFDFILDRRVTAFSRVKRGATGPDVGGVEGFDEDTAAAAASAASGSSKKVQ